MRRWHSEISVMRKRTASEYAKHSEHGRYRKYRPADCGHSDCFMCHSEKLMPKARATAKRLAIAESLDIAA